MTPIKPTGSLFQRYLYRNYRAYSRIKYWFQRRLTKGFLILLMAVTLLAALGVDTNLAMAYQAFAFIVCLLLVAIVASRFSRPRFLVRRQLPRFGSVGAPLTYTVMLENCTAGMERGLSLLEDLSDPRPSLREFVETPEPGEGKRNWFDRKYAFYRWTWLISKKVMAVPQEQPVPPMPARGTVEIQMHLTPLRRGVLRFRGVAIACPEPFGLFRALVTIPQPQSLLILPRRYPVPPLALPGTMKYQQGGVALASAVGQSEEFVALRDYRAGDPLRHIHWKSWAKTGKPIVKEFQDEFFVRHALILDTFCASAHNDRFEAAVSVAASFAWTLQTQESLLDLMFIGPEAYCFTAGRGLAHAEQILEILACVEVCRDKPFDSLTQLMTQHLSAVSGCICVFLEWDDARQLLVQRLHSLGIPALVLVLTDTNNPGEAIRGVLAGEASSFHEIEVGRIAESLAKL